MHYATRKKAFGGFFSLRQTVLLLLFALATVLFSIGCIITRQDLDEVVVQPLTPPVDKGFTETFTNPQKENMNGTTNSSFSNNEGMIVDLHRIKDPINELVASASMTQLHHGIYRVSSPLADGSGESITFALKTECRPSSKWHGQQGWPEVALYIFQELFRQNDNVTYPRTGYARGVVVSITEEQLSKVLHSDQCGVLHDVNPLKMAFGTEVLRGRDRNGGNGNANSTVLLIGVALAWEERYDDEMYPHPKNYAPYFVTPSTGEKLHGMQQEEVFQYSDVFLFDYLFLNPDRVDKNWFRDKATRKQTVLMDNGWGFVGQNYESSICVVKDISLQCPSLLISSSIASRSRRRWNCNTVKYVEPPLQLEWCRFRPQTVMALNRTRAQWHNEKRENGSLSSLWLKELRSDVLMAFLLKTYGNKTKTLGSKKKNYSVALARFIDNCPPPDWSEKYTKKLTQSSESDILMFLELGLLARMNRLAVHVEKCLNAYGPAYVFVEDVTSM